MGILLTIVLLLVGVWYLSRPARPVEKHIIDLLTEELDEMIDSCTRD